MKIRDFLPPILYRVLGNSEKVEKKQKPTEIFQTFEEAQQACSGFGYEENVLVQTVFEKTLLFKSGLKNGGETMSDAMMQALLAVLLSCQVHREDDRIGIIDFGGASGAHYFQIRPFLPAETQIDWVVVETHAMVDKAKAMETDELHFAKSIGEAKEKLQKVHLLYSSGTIQYVPSPRSVLREMVDCRPETIFLNRLALSTTTEMITTQETMLSVNGPGALPHGIEDRLCRYPITYFPKHELEKILTQAYDIKIRFQDAKISAGGQVMAVNGGYYLAKVS